MRDVKKQLPTFETTILKMTDKEKVKRSLHALLRRCRYIKRKHNLWRVGRSISFLFLLRTTNKLQETTKLPQG